MSLSIRHTAPVSISTSRIHRPHGLSNLSTFASIAPSALGGGRLHKCRALLKRGKARTKSEELQHTPRHLKRQGVLLVTVALAACGEATAPETPAPLRVDVTVTWRQLDCATLWTATANYPLRLIQYDLGLYNTDTQRTSWYETGSFQGTVTEVLPRASNPIASWEIRADGYQQIDREAPQGGCP